MHRRLRTCFPSSLEDWDSRYTTSCSPLTFPPDTVALEPIDAIAVINLARRCNFSDILASALYICSQLPILELVNHVRYGEEDVERLSQEDLARCLHLVETLPHNMGVITKLTRLNVIPGACQRARPDECCKAWEVVYVSYMEGRYGMPRDFFANTRQLLDCRDPWSLMCAACRDETVAIYQNFRKAQWNSLHVISIPC